MPRSGDDGGGALGSGDEAMEIFHMLNPINHARTPSDVERYKAEPYVTAGDVYAHPEHMGRSGWSWYTGSAGWLYRAGLEELLDCGAMAQASKWIPAFRPHGHRSPSPGASEARATRSRSTTPRATAVASTSATLDGAACESRAIPLVDDGGTHRVSVTMGDPKRP
jgi:cyclic beta-1,2-glucan synthetase